MKKIFFLTFCLLFLPLGGLLAQEDSLKMTLTPPLIKNNMNPGEKWLSTVKLVNNNKKKITVYTDIQDFKSSPDGGVELVPKEESEGDGAHTGFLRNWMQIQEGPIEIEAYDSAEIPFEINVPESAEPGGHYAAILVGTKPVGQISGSGISISSMISSLVLVNISGDVIEEGRIREFSTDKTYYKNPQVKFKLRFENTGNVHLQPKGSIVIRDMFGNQKGLIDINKNTAYGNVLPDSKKAWEFDWSGEAGFFKMGRYDAEVTLHYGENTKEVDNRSFYFWYLDFKLLGIIFGSIFGFVLILIILIKFYIKKAVRKSQRELELLKKSQQDSKKENEAIPDEPANKEKKTGKSGVVDLKEIMKKK